MPEISKFLINNQVFIIIENSKISDKQKGFYTENFEISDKILNLKADNFEISDTKSQFF